MKILYVEDEIAHVVLAQRTLEDNLHQAFVLIHAETIQDALMRLDADSEIDLVLSDLRLPDGTGLDLLHKILQRKSPPAVVLVTGQGDQEVAVAALKAGAVDYLVKQSDYLHRLPVVISNAIAQNQLAREQAALRSAERRFRILVEQMPAAVYTDLADEYSSAVYISPHIEDILGFTPEEWLENPRTWIERVHADDRERVLNHLRITHLSHSDFNLDYRFLHRDGHEVWVRDVAKLILDEDGQASYWQGILFDITTERETVERIRKSEERFRRIFHASPIATCVISLNDDSLIDANQAFLHLLGKSLDELLGHTSADIGLWKSTAGRELLIHELQENGSIQGVGFQFWDVPNGPRDTIAYHELIELGGIICILSMYYDVTEEKKAQSALQAERDFALQVLNNMGQGLTVTTKDGRFEYVNPAFASMLGHPKDEILGKTPEDFTSETSKLLLEEMRMTRREGLTSTYESTLIHKDSHEVPALITGVPRRIDNEIQGAIAVITDLTQQKAAERALERQIQELTILHSVAIAEAESRSEDELIERVTQIVAQIYPEQCGFLFLNANGTILTPHRSYLGAKLENWMEGHAVTQGITGRAITRERIIRVDDVSMEAGYLEMSKGIRSELCVPVRVNGQAIGVLNVESSKPSAFQVNDERFLNTIANSLGTALERLRLFDEEQQRSRELNALYQTTRALAQSLDPIVIARNLVTTMEQLLGYEYASIYLLDENTNLLVPAALSEKSQNIEIYEDDKKGLPAGNRTLGQGIIGWVAQHGEAIRTGDITKETRYLPIIKGIASELCVPLKISEKVIGALNIETTVPDAYTERDESLLTALANSAATAFENARRYRSELTRRELAEALRMATASLSSAADLESLYQVILDSAGKLVDYDHASLQVFNEDCLETVAESGFAAQPFMQRRTPWDLERWDSWETFWENNSPPLLVGNAHDDPRFRITGETIIEQSWIGAPVLVGERIFGLINLISQTPDHFTKENGIIIQTFAAQAGIAIEKAQLFETERRHHREAELLREVTASLATSLELEPLLDKILDSISKLVSYDSASIFLENQQDELVIVATRGIPEPASFVGRKVSKSQKWYQLAQHQASLILDNVQNDPMFETWDGTEYIRSWMGIPMTAQDKVIGYINLDSRRINRFTKQDAVLAQTYANSAAIALGNANLYQEAVRAAERRAVLHRISQDIVRFGKDLAQIYAAIHEAASRLMPCDVFLILIKDNSKKEYLSVYSVEAGIHYEPVSVQMHAGLSALVIEKGQSIILTNDTEIQQRKVIHFGSPKHVQSAVAVPMRMGNQVIGMISAQCYEPFAYGNEEQTLLEMLSTHAATAVENGRLFESEQKRREEAENLRHAATVISSTLDLNQLLEEILKALKQVIYYDNASVFLLEGDWLRLVICQGFSNADALIDQRFPSNDVLFAELCESMRPIVIRDAKEDPRYENWGDSFQVRGWMGVPLISHGRVIGYITLDNYLPAAYDESFAETAMAFANQAAAGIENAWLYQEQTRRAHIIQTLADIANEIATTRDVVPVLNHITQRALEMLKANHVAIYLLQDDKVSLKTAAAHGVYRDQILSHTFRVNEGITGKVFANAKAEIIHNTREDPRRVIVPGTPEQEESLESLMVSPLMLRGVPIGVINAWRRKDDGLFNESELNFLVGIAHQVSICIESGRLFQETSRQAQEAAAIAEVGRDISATLELDIVLERIASYAMNLLHSETSAVYLAEGNSLRAIAALGTDSDEIKNDPLVIGNGILGNIALQSMGEIVNDTATDARAITVKGTEQLVHENLMGAPIMLKERHTGLLAVWRTGEGTDFKDHELKFLTSLARQAAVAIENARLYDETQRQIKELEIINRVSTSLRAAQSIEEMLPILLNETMELINSTHGSIWLYDHTINKLVQKAASGTASGIPNTQLNPTEGIVGRTFTTGSKYTASSLQDDPLLFEPNRRNLDSSLAAIFIPIQSMAGPIGVLVIGFEKGRQITAESHLLTILAEVTGNSIHRIQLYEQSQKQVRRLTTLRDIDAAIASSFDLRLTLNILMDQTINHLNVDAVQIGLYHPDLQSLTYLGSTGFQTTVPTRPRIRLGEGLAGQVIVRQSTLHVTNLQSAPETQNELLIRREGFVTYIGIPLIVKGQIKGVFEIFHRSALSPTLDWMEFLHTLAGQAAIAIDSSQLFENLQRSNQELMQAYDTTLEGWARALELRDRETEGHTRRVTELTMQLARYMGISDSEMVNIHRGVLLHDIGKMGVPDHILKKTGKLSDEEWVEMRQHPVYAYNLLAPISYLRSALDIPYSHHEHWDGSGYPQGLKGERIPLSARIFSVVDIWDALLSDRPYRKAWTREKVIQYLKDVAGTILDPKIVEIFLDMVENGKKQTG